MMLICVLVYHLQGKPGMYDLLRPYLIIVNLAFFAWFVVLQYIRFRPTGRACSGDFLVPNKILEEGKPDVKYPANYATVYLGE